MSNAPCLTTPASSKALTLRVCLQTFHPDRFVENEPEKKEDGEGEEETPAIGDIAASSATRASAAITAAPLGAPASSDTASLALELRQLRAEVALQMEGMNQVRSQMERVLMMVAQQGAIPAEAVAPSPSLSGGKAKALSLAHARRGSEPVDAAIPVKAASLQS